MSFIKFVFSKAFLIQLAIALVVFCVLLFLVMQWLDYSTNHDQKIEVPNLSKLTLDQVDELLEEADLRREVNDSANYNPDYPKYSVIEQSPKAGDFVKENRMIYLTLNPSGYAKAEIPEYNGRSRRQIEPTLLALGFQIGSITYKPSFAKDAVLELRHKGAAVKKGDELMKTSVIDLVLGDGKESYNDVTSDDNSSEGSESTETATETSDDLEL
ncbi:PASTA domain-containing protein [Mesonia sp. K7]|uniref:PASTA domain-containing protein n=1 Tax=Mesonia sp. K7 TaxID=2218606 RepID=UPI000DA7DEB7|nr:PASTA domain-containing protein [Mesonia sp. K7]PZD78309.1 serine/threonine protein kinase [Mesonia sp. K7]